MESTARLVDHVLFRTTAITTFTVLVFLFPFISGIVNGKDTGFSNFMFNNLILVLILMFSYFSFKEIRFQIIVAAFALFTSITFSSCVLLDYHMNSLDIFLSILWLWSAFASMLSVWKREGVRIGRLCVIGLVQFSFIFLLIFFWLASHVRVFVTE